MRCHSPWTTLGLLAVLAPAACGGGGATGPFRIVPEQVFTGIEDTGVAYKAPILATTGDGLTFTSDDTTIATVAPDSAASDQAIVTAVAAGEGNVTAVAGGVMVAVPIDVQPYKTADRMAGASAFTTNGCNAALCHDGSAGSPDNTPSALAGYADNEILMTITTGRRPGDGSLIVATIPHKFTNLSTQEQTGVVAYLRSLPPLGKPHQDHP